LLAGIASAEVLFQARTVKFFAIGVEGIHEMHGGQELSVLLRGKKKSVVFDLKLSLRASKED